LNKHVNVMEIVLRHVTFSLNWKHFFIIDVVKSPFREHAYCIDTHEQLFLNSIYLVWQVMTLE